MRSLNTRLIAGLFLVALIPLLFFYMLHRLVQEQQLLELERRDMAISGEHAVRLLEGAGRQMLATLEDYAIWNETYDQIDLQEAGWLAENFTDWLPSHFGFRLIALLDRQGQPVYTYGVPPGENPGRWREVHAALAGGRVSGFKELGGNLYLVAASPVLHSDRSGPLKGALVFGKPVNDAFVVEVGKNALHPIVLFFGGRIYGPPEATSRLAGIDINPAREGAVYVNDDLALQSMPLKDTAGRYVAGVGVLQSRQHIHLASRTLKRNTGLAALFACTLALVLTLALRRAVLRPVIAMQQQLDTMAEEKALRPLQGVPADELAGFQRTFNFLVDAVAEKEKELERLAATDDLTGLFNHRSFVRDLEALHEAAAPFAVLMCDLDNLKLLNDARGHLAGDRLLQKAAATIGRAVAGRGTAYRYGGDEFAVLLPGADAAAAAAVAGRIRREVADLALPEEPDPLFCATISIGSATFPEDGRNGAELVANADRALAAAKQRGRNQVVPYDPELETFAPVGAEAHTSLLMDVIRSLAAVVDVRDQYTGSHSEQVGELASRLGQAAGLSPRQCFYLRIAGLLHDCGKIGLPDTVLRKQGPLTPDEQVLVRQHPVLSGRIVQHLRTLEIIRPWVIHHHERYDGTGYPEGLQGEAIPLEARILAIADAYHAMVSHRPCRPALSEEMACEELQAQRGRQFDPRLVDIFLARVLPARAAEAG